MRQTILRRGAVVVLGLVALLFATLGVQPSTTVSAAGDIYSNVGCTFGDNACLYAHGGYSYVNYSYTPTTYYPSYTNYPVNYGYNYAYTPAYNYAYTPVYYNAYTPVNYGFANFGYGFGYGYGVPARAFTREGCNVGNYTCLKANR